MSATLLGLLPPLAHTAETTPPATPPAPAAAIPFPEVEFETRRIRTAAEPGSGPLLLTYRFVNKAGFPLAVEEFVQTCTCMTGEWDGEPVEMDGAGEIRARFLAGGRRGRVTKSLVVKFVGLGAVELVAEVDVPASVTLSSHDLVWPADDAAAELSVDLTAGTDAGFRITALLGLAPAEFAVRAETLVEGRHYRLFVTPGPSAPASATRCLQIRTDSPDPRDRVLALFLAWNAPADPPQPRSSEPSSPPPP